MVQKLGRFFTLGLIALLTASLVSIAANKAYAADNNWYVGEGVQKDMYVEYEIQHFDTNDGRPFVMSIYFKEQDDQGNWITPVYVVDQGKVMTGELRLSDLDLTNLGASSNIPPEMSRYVSAYSQSLKWLSSFAPKPGKSLDAPSWGRTASIGGSPVGPSGTEQVTVPAGTYDTTVILYHKGVDNKIWVLNEFPYPVKALTYVDITQGEPPIEYAFELLKTGMGEPPVPEGFDVVPTPPLEKTTGRGTYMVTLDWLPASIESGKETTFGLSFSENNGFPLERVNYDIVIKNSSGGVVQEFKNQNTGDDGIASHQVMFESDGAMKITVTINSISGSPASTAGFVESADFDIVVVPEFPVSAAIVAGSVVGLVVLLTRMRGSGISSLFSNRNL